MNKPTHRQKKIQKPNDSTDVFATVHRALARGHLRSALRMLLDDCGRPKGCYRVDLNHAWYLIGDVHYRLGNYDSALSALKRSLRNWRDDYQAMWAIADCHLAKGELSRGEFWLRAAYEVSGSLEVAYDLGNCFFDQGMYRIAAVFYTLVREEASGELKRRAMKNMRIARTRIVEA